MVIIEVKTLAPETYYEKSTQAGRKTASGIFAPAAVKHSYKLGSAAQDLCRKNRFGGSKTASGVRHYYYNDQWKCIEERKDAETDAERQYAWGTQFRNDLILRDRDTTGNGTLDERLYATHDALGNCTAILNTSGAVQERYGYSAFGVRRIMQADFSARASSSFAWDFGFQGEFLDDETGYINYGYRYYLPYVGKWVNRDPIVEDGGANLYSFVYNNAVNLRDSYGLLTASEICACIDVKFTNSIDAFFRNTGWADVSGDYLPYGYGSSGINSWVEVKWKETEECKTCQSENQEANVSGIEVRVFNNGDPKYGRPNRWAPLAGPDYGARLSGGTSFTSQAPDRQQLPTHLSGQLKIQIVALSDKVCNEKTFTITKDRETAPLPDKGPFKPLF